MDWVQQIEEHPESGSLTGKFHAHLTVKTERGDVAELRDCCRKLNVKLTIVDLENQQGQSQTDVMTTSYYQDPEPGAVSRITQQLSETSKGLEAAGYDVIRAKLEHESLPTISNFDQTRYHEVHIKLHIPEAAYKTTHSQLAELGVAHGFVPSRNPLDRTDGVVTQFVNKRIYEGTREEADAIVESVLESIADFDLEVVEVKRETVVFDTHQQLDRWWT